MVAAGGAVAFAIAPAVSASAASCTNFHGFEIDGNFAPGDCGGLDWTSPSVNYSTTNTVGTYSTSNKDNTDPSGWTSAGSTPSKDTFTRVFTWAHSDAGHYILYAGWERQQTSGTSGYVIDVTNAPGTTASDGTPRPNHSNGGFVFYFTMTGSNPPVLGESCVYHSQADYPSTASSPGCTIGNGGSNFAAAVSTTVLTDPKDGTSVPSGGFYEIGIDVTGITGIAPGCPAPSADSVYMRAFTGQSSGPGSNLKAWVAPLSVAPPSTCGSLTVTKQVNGVTNDASTSFPYTVSGPTPHSGSLTAGSTDTYSDVKPGTTYTLAEGTVPPNWALQSIVCTVDGHVYTLNAQTPNFPVETGMTTACVITNATSGVNVTKVAVGAGGAQFPFTITPPGSPSGDFKLANGQTSSTYWYLPGTQVTVRETEPSGNPLWHPTNIVCSGGTNAVADIAAGTVTFNTVAGQTIDCTYTNTQDGAITIVKNVVGKGSTFAYTSADLPGGGFSIDATSGTGSKDYPSVTPGTYHVSETAMTGYDLTGLACSNQASTTSGADATISVAPGEHVTCTYTNTQRGNIVVKKVTDPTGSTQSFDFTLTGGPTTIPGFSLKDGQSNTSTNVKPGDYTLTEAAVAAWTTTTITCVNGAQQQIAQASSVSDLKFTVAPGDTVTCTVLNTATQGSLSVTKHVTGVDPSYQWSFPISLSNAPGGQVNPQTVNNGSPTASWNHLIVGQQYTVSEQLPSGWTQTAFTCNVPNESQTAGQYAFTVTPGAQISCDITNAAKPADVSLTKTVMGVADGTAWSFDFTLTPGPGQAASDTKSATNASPTISWTGLTPGKVYSITEAPKAGWTEGAITCVGLTDADPAAPGFQFTAQVDQHLNCTVQNVAAPGSVTVQKTSVGKGGTFGFALQPLDGSGMPVGSPIVQSVTTPVGGGTASTTFQNLTPGAWYSLAEQNPGSSWITGGLTCTVTHLDKTTASIDPSKFTLAVGDAISCTITNTAKGNIVIVKNIDGNDGTFDFTGTWAGGSSFSITTTNHTGTATFTDVVAGSYTVQENLTEFFSGKLLSCVASGEAQSYPASTVDPTNVLLGHIELAPGETVTCTYSNTQLSKIIVNKVVDNVGSIPGGSSVQFPFAWGGAASGTFDLMAGGSADTGLVMPGTYTVTEGATANWALQSLVCDNLNIVKIAGSTATITLPSATTVNCTYTNKPNTGKVSVTKHVEGVPAGYDWGSFTMNITPAVSGQPTSQNVTPAAPTVSWTDLVVGQSYTIWETSKAGWQSGAVMCTGADGSTNPETGAFTFTVVPGANVSCDVTNTAVPGKVTVTKDVTGMPAGIPWSFTFSITPTTGVGGAAITGAVPQTISGTGSGMGGNTASWGNLAIATTYTVSEIDVPAGWTAGSLVCGDAQTSSFTVKPGDDIHCTITNAVIPPTGNIVKKLTKLAQKPDGTWDLEYTVSVTNSSPVAPLVYTLNDQPYFGSGIVINSAAAYDPMHNLIPGWSPNDGHFTLVGAVPPTSVGPSGTAVYTIDINATAGASVYSTSSDKCVEGNTSIGGFRNTAFLMVTGQDTKESSACGQPAKTTVVKTLDGAPTRDAATGDWTVNYKLTVTNESATLPQFYDLSDTLGFPAGVVVKSATATNNAGVDTSAWNGASNTVLATGEAIAPSAVHTYSISVKADVTNITTIDDAMCLENTSGHGFFNSAELMNGTISTPVNACGDIPIAKLTLVKHVDNSQFSGLDLGANTLLHAGGWTRTATMDSLTVGDASGGATDMGTFTAVVPIGTYTLAEELTAAAKLNSMSPFYTPSGWTCGPTGGQVGEGTVTTVGLVTGGDVTCAITNTGHPVDLKIVKSHESQDALGDWTVPTDVNAHYVHTFTVSNSSTVDVPNVVVTDHIPSTLKVDPKIDWTIPAGWTADITGTDANGFGGTLTFTKIGPWTTGEATSFLFKVGVTTAPDLPREGGSPTARILDIVNTATVTSAGVEATPSDNTSTDVVPVKSLQLNLQAMCLNDVPVVDYAVTPFNVDKIQNLPIVLIWWTKDAFAHRNPAIPASDPAAILANGASRVDHIAPPPTPTDGVTISGQKLWPGAAVDATGKAIAWPGWRQLPTGQWVLDPSAPFYNLRSGAVLEVRMNPSTAETLSSPSTGTTCAPPPFHPPAMAETGFSQGWLFPVAGGLLTSGLALLVMLFVIRRRRPHEE